MKTSTIYFCLFFCISYLHTNAQLRIGIQGGLSNAWEEYGDVGLPDDAEIDIRGFNISGMVYYEVNTYLSLGVEPGYSKRGAACIPGWNNERIPFFNGDTKLFLHYIEMPLMVEGRFPLWKDKLDVFGKLGYGASFLGSAFEETVDLSSDPEETFRSRIDLANSESLRRIDHGLYSAAGFRLHFSKQSLFVSVNHYRGLRDADPENKSLNRDLGLRVGWMMVL